jgi:Flp pilus assembly pilin Flp
MRTGGTEKLIRAACRSLKGPALTREGIHTRKGPTMNFLLRVLREDDGQDMIEYALLGSFISIVVIVALGAIGPFVSTVYQGIWMALTVPIAFLWT